MSRSESVKQWLKKQIYYLKVRTKNLRVPKSGIDENYLRSIDYKYMTMEGMRVRCDLCGKWKRLKYMPQMIEHVASHDGQGSAEINPFESEYVRLFSEESRCETSTGPTDDSGPAVYGGQLNIAVSDGARGEGD